MACIAHAVRAVLRERDAERGRFKPAASPLPPPPPGARARARPVEAATETLASP